VSLAAMSVPATFKKKKTTRGQFWDDTRASSRDEVKRVSKKVFLATTIRSRPQIDP